MSEASPREPACRRKRYEKPCVRLEQDIETLAGTCEPLGMDTLQDKLSFEPSTSLCRNPIT